MASNVKRKKKSFGQWSITVNDGFVCWEYPCQVNTKFSIDRFMFHLRKGLKKHAKQFGLPKIVEVKPL